MPTHHRRHRNKNTVVVAAAVVVVLIAIPIAGGCVATTNVGDNEPLNSNDQAVAAAQPQHGDVASTWTCDGNDSRFICDTYKNKISEKCSGGCKQNGAGKDDECRAYPHAVGKVEGHPAKDPPKKTCPSDQQLCPDMLFFVPLGTWSCVDTNVDPLNCGNCGSYCGTDGNGGPNGCALGQCFQ